MNRTIVRLVGTMIRLLGRLHRPWAVGALEALFLRIRRHPTPAREAQWLADGDRLEIEWAGGRLAAWSWGDGPRAVLLAHGWEGRGSQLGAFVAPLRAAGFRVVTFDAPGHGASSGRRSTLPDMAEGIRAVARAVGGVDAIVAHSAGSAATSVAVARGLEVSRLVYLSPPANLGRFLYLAADALGGSRELAGRVQVRLERRYDLYWEDLLPTVIGPRRPEPLLVVHDENDREVPIEQGEAVVRAWPRARLLRTRRLGHRRLLRNPDVVAAVVRFVAASARRSNHYAA